MFCSQCGQQLSAEAVFCGHCGLQLKEQLSTTHSAPRRRAFLALGVYLFVVMLLSVPAAWHFLRPDSETINTIAIETKDTSAPVQQTETVTVAIATPTSISSSTPSAIVITVLPLPTLLAASTLTPMNTSTSMPTPLPPPTETAVLIETQIIGQSVNNREIEAVRFGNGPNVVIFIGGLHAGAAPSSVALANRAISHFTNNLGDVPTNVTLYIIPNANPDTPFAPGELDGRLNANNVDINRNWDCRWVEDARWRNEVIPGSGGPAPFSEPETQALADFITGHDAVAVVFWEARATNGLSSPGFCEGRTPVSGSLATTYGQAAGYPIGDFEDLTNQELNGDGTNWLDSQGIPAIAVLLPDYETVDWPSSLAAMRAVLTTHGN
jgi:eukaryotic-like serine/threonine-protein kinase